jgi:imidazolonepropionase-like amidohydrolase
MKRIQYMLILATFLTQGNNLVTAQEKPIVILSETLIDGKGKILHNTPIVIEGSKIKSVGGAIPHGATVYNLGKLTVTPGLIDVHDHIIWHFDNRHLAGKDEPPMQAILSAAENAVLTLDAGFTTIQSPGSPNDKYLRDAIARGILPGPRILTSLEPLHDTSGPPETIRELVRERKRQGADFIKIFASNANPVSNPVSDHDPKAHAMTDEQIQAACGEANKLGMRTIVHAHIASAAKAATLAGCTSIEHGGFVTDDVFELMAQHGTYYDPNVGLVLQNYDLNKDKYIGVGGYTATSIANMVNEEGSTFESFRRSLKIKGLNIIYGTDAVAGAHGRNGEEYIARVKVGGEDPMAGLISATSLSAQLLGLQDQIGSIATGMQADIIAMDGNPLIDPTVLRKVVFVMKGGKIFKNIVSSSPAKE